MGKTTVNWGGHRKIEVGTVTRQYFCMNCHSARPFNSKKQLNCLAAGPDLVSIDVILKCVDCFNTVENWFLVRCPGDLYGQNPSVSLVHHNEHLGDSATALRPGDGTIHDLLERADLASRFNLGSGAMIYLRKIFEMVIFQVARTIGVSTSGRNGGRKTFKDILTEVDGRSQIVPPEFSRNGYRLFSELSEVIHGDSDEEEALNKYQPCRRLVLGVVENISNKTELDQALATLGWQSQEDLEGSVA